MMYPIIYKQIPTQYAFFMEKQADGKIKLRQQQVIEIPENIVFNSKEEAIKYIKDYKIQL